MEETKFCKFCGEKIPFDAVVCTKCGRQVERIERSRDKIIINNVSNSSAYVTRNGGKMVNKWLALGLCLFGGFLGLHRFYEGKIITGLLYLFTLGLFFFGWGLDFLIILCKPNPYEV